MPDEVEGFDPELGPIVAIPLPFYERSPRTRFKEKPMCCDTIFKTVEAYERHWLNTHHVTQGETQC